VCGRADRQGGPAIAAFELLWHDIDLDVSPATASPGGPAVIDALDYLTTGAVHDLPRLAHMHYRIRPGSTGWAVDEEGDHLDTVPDPEAVLDLVYRRVHQRAFELASLRGWVRLHAAVVDLGADSRSGPPEPTRVLLVAPSGGGKTTLACRLLLDGEQAVADESVLVRQGVALPVARRFHLKPGAEEVVVGLDRHLDAVPELADGTVRAFDPSAAGFAWPIVAREVDHVVLIERGPGPGELVPASAVEAMPVLVDQSFPHQEATGELLAQVAALLREARCWQLRGGSVEEASILVRRLRHE
jgi:hypothetical protein